MAKRTATELNDAIKTILAAHDRGPAELAATRARSIFDQALGKGKGFEDALGAIYLVAFQDFEAARPKRVRGPRTASKPANGTDAVQPNAMQATQPVGE